MSGAAVQLTIMEMGLEQRFGESASAAERGLEQLRLASAWEGEVSSLTFLKGQTAAALYTVGRNSEADILASESKAEIAGVYQGERRDQLLRELDGMLQAARQAYQDGGSD